MKSVFTQALRSLPLALLASLAFVASAASAEPVACFEWECDLSTHECSFDASCSEGSPFIWKYQFDFGDSTPVQLTGSPYISHDYGTNLPACSDERVKLTVIPWSDPTAETSCFVKLSTCPWGPNLPASGTCTSD